MIRFLVALMASLFVASSFGVVDWMITNCAIAAALLSSFVWAIWPLVTGAYRPTEEDLPPSMTHNDPH